MEIRAPWVCAWSSLVLVVAAGCAPRTGPSDGGLDGGRDAARTFLDVPPADVWFYDVNAPPDVPYDGTPPDAYDPRLCVTFEPGSFGSPCREDGTCDAGLSCGSDVTFRVDELTGMVRSEVALAGTCTRRCDPDATRPCGPCGVCITSVPIGASRLSVTDAAGHGYCVQPCWAAPRGALPACLGPYACDRVSLGCVPACERDEDCLLVSTSPGAFERLPETPPLSVTCGTASGACLRAEGGGVLGDDCADDLDCATGYLCDRGLGHCAALSDCEGRGCGLGAACSELEPGIWACTR